MTATLELRAVQRGTGPPSLDAAYSGQRIALAGDWSWLRAHLAGARPIASGQVVCLGEDGRSAAVSGKVGVSLAGLFPVPDDELSHFLGLNLELWGQPRPAARDTVGRLLSDLELDSLSRRRISTLNEVESFAANAAFAASTHPELLVLEAPIVIAETRDFVLGLMTRLALRHRLAFGCPPGATELLQFADEVAELSHSAIEGTLSASREYRVKPMRAASALSSALEDRGAVVRREGAVLIVSLPEGASTELIVDAAVALSEPLAELLPLQS